MDSFGDWHPASVVLHWGTFILMPDNTSQCTSLHCVFIYLLRWLQSSHEEMNVLHCRHLELSNTRLVSAGSIGWILLRILSYYYLKKPRVKWLSNVALQKMSGLLVWWYQFKEYIQIHLIPKQMTFILMVIWRTNKHKHFYITEYISCSGVYDCKVYGFWLVV